MTSDTIYAIIFMNVVIDCNIFISAVLSQNGTAVEVLRYALKKIYSNLDKTFKEYEDVLSREHIIKILNYQKMK